MKTTFRVIGGVILSALLLLSAFTINAQSESVRSVHSGETYRATLMIEE